MLPADVVLRPADDIGGHLVGRPRSRAAARVVNAATAMLLRQFTSPRTIVDAVIACSAGSDPRATLAAAYPVLAEMINEGLLVDAGSPLAEPVEATLGPGDRFAGLEVMACVHLVVDTEVYRARAADGSAVALKIARAGTGRALLHHEGEIVERLDGQVNAALHSCGELHLATSWAAGLDVHTMAAELRRAPRVEPLAQLVVDVVGAYAHLHRQGVLHGDVHPRNVLVGPGGAVTLVDFAFAETLTGPPIPAVARGGVDVFCDPAAAAARLAGESPPPMSVAAEQYRLAAMIYLLLTGVSTHGFALERAAMLRQVCEQPPTPLARGDLAAAEEVLTTALSKHPDQRYPSVAALHAALAVALGIG